ncbi:hypothetical protein [Mesorhizobium sp. 8]|uniref:hypothetical protein n=1 Tax=Mesorhizobium sp. 8 TaxID=2584466 RepID=UPI0015D67569|nr:hypothetical protein [Mesorhizobium sp. 8]
MSAIIYGIGAFVAFHIAMWALAHVIHWFRMMTSEKYRAYDRDLREAAEDRRRYERF